MLVASDGCSDGTVAWVIGGLWGSAAVLILSMVLSRSSRPRAAAATAAVAFGYLAALEARAVGRHLDLNRQIATIHRMRDYGNQMALWAQQHESAGELPVGPMLFPGFPDPGVEPQDAWHHPFVYQRISPTVALLVAPGSDGVVSWNMKDATSHRFFGYGALEEDLVMKIELHRVSFLATPKVPTFEACPVPSLLGCLCLAGE
jgi:hypothetical protein